MRSDFLGDCSHFWDLPEAINESQYLIPRLTRDQLREVIEGPVAVGDGPIAPAWSINCSMTSATTRINYPFCNTR